MATSFNNQAVTGVLSLSGGDAGGLLIAATGGPLHLVQSGTRSGTVTANNATGVNVPCPSLTASSLVLLTVKTSTGANAGQAFVASATAGNNFTIKSGADDQSVYNWSVIEMV
jgi:hypothetical protein